MKLFDPDPSIRWLFCMTHPDDEISICAWIRECVRNGCEVAISWTHSIPVREREGRAVAHMLGVPSRNLHFFGATDGSVCDEIAELIPKFGQLMNDFRPDRVVCGAFEQGHLDHDSTNYIVNQTFDGPILEVPFYHTYLTPLQVLNRFSDPRGQEVWELDNERQAFKRLIARQYPSQNIWSVVLWHEIGQTLRLKPWRLAKTEQMRLQGSVDFSRPNHPPKLSQKVETSPKWARWSRTIKALGPDPRKH